MIKKIVDISTHNGNIDFKKLKTSVDGVIIRAGYGWYNKDKKFDQNLKGCLEYGIPYGIYFYTYATNLTLAKKEMDLFLKHIKGLRPNLPVVIDQEDAEGYKKKNGNPGWKTLAEITRYQCKRLEEEGYYAMYYASTYWHDQMVKVLPDLKNIDLWLAHWGIKSPSRPCGIWQYTSDGKVDGIKGRCDLNICYVNYPTLIKAKGLNGWKKTENKKPEKIVEKKKERAGFMKNKKYVITYELDGDLANAQALLNALGTKAVLTKGPVEKGEGYEVIQVGGSKKDWADTCLTGADRVGTLLSIAEFCKSAR